MTSRSKEKVVSVFHRIFRNGDRDKEGAAGQGGGSPGRRLMRHHMVTPAEMKPPEAPPGASKVSTFFKKKQQPQSQAAESGVTEMGIPKSVRSRRLMKELNDIQKNQAQDPPFTVELINDNLYDWHVRLYSVDSESDLAADMREYGVSHISLQLTFPENFPFVPPFMRVVSPRIEKGFVMEGGAICMELLTPRGWASAYTVEAIVMQFAASIVKGQVLFLCCTNVFDRRSYHPQVQELLIRTGLGGRLSDKKLLYLRMIDSYAYRKRWDSIKIKPVEIDKINYSTTGLPNRNNRDLFTKGFHVGEYLKKQKVPVRILTDVQPKNRSEV